ncbi:MAG: Ger(x)C family spore germination protein [Clostridiaceae bacterium]
MKKYLYKWFEIFLCILLVINLSACWSAKELNTLAIVMGIGIDKLEKSDQVKVTIQLAKTEEIKNPGKGSSGSVSPYINLQNTGMTINEAMKGFNHLLSRRLFLSDNQVVIFSESVAEEGLKSYVDFLLRNRETRLLVTVYVCSGEASEFFSGDAGFEKLPSRKMGELGKIQEQFSQNIRVNLKNFTGRMMSKTSSPIAPIIKLSKDVNKDVIGIFETAVFKKDKMVGKLNEVETRGLAWGIDEVKGGTIEIESPEEKKNVSISITKSKGKITPIINEDEITMLIEIEEECDLAEEESTEDLVNPKAFEELQKSIASKIKNEVLSADLKAKELNADIFGFGDEIYRRYPKKWKEIEEDWDEVFQKINVVVKVEAKLKRAGRITKPILFK